MDLVNIVKSSKTIYNIYCAAGNFTVRILKLFCKTNNKLILFVSYGGRRYSDSPAVIYEAMLNDERYKGYEFVWAFRDPDAVEMPGNAKKIRINSLGYILTALRARCWVTNVNVERGLNFLGKKTYYFHTTHGVLPKFVGNDVNQDDLQFNTKFGYHYDMTCSQSDFETQIIKRAYQANDNQVLPVGYPRNDLLAKATLNDQIRLKKKYGYPFDKKIILYAPTFRDDSADATDVKVNFKKWEEALGKEFVVIFRAHPITTNLVEIDSTSKFVFDGSAIPDIMELYIIADYLISDYSGVFFDYAITERPMICYGYDYDSYIKNRPLYINLAEELPGGHISEDDLIEIIRNSSISELIEKTKSFKRKYVTYCGNATRACLDNIYEEIGGND